MCECDAAALEEFIRRKVAAGEFSSVDEMVAEGVRVLQQQEERWATEARRKIDEGWAQGQAGESRTIEQVRTNLAERIRTITTGADAGS